ncbi:MAG TPA: hypothetical protein PL033_09190 [Candidatus Brocadiia bacterium]|nr:hypothetical protein [Candidatus Brocadiia bacterium]
MRKAAEAGFVGVLAFLCVTGIACPDFIHSDASAEEKLPRQGAPEPGVNLALGKKCDFIPRPNYRYCTDPGDPNQLTDGKFTSAYFWVWPGTVGWQGRQATVSIDLGRVEPIDSVAVNMAGGGHAGVFFPIMIVAIVSDDGKAYRKVAAVSEPGLKQYENKDGHWYVHKFRTPKLATRGRYVQVGMQARGDFIFTDEIEVMKGDHDPANVKFDDAKTFASADQFMTGTRKLGRLTVELEALRAYARGDTAVRRPSQVDELKPELDAIEKEIYEAVGSAEAVERLASRIGRARAGMWAKECNHEGLVCWAGDPMVNISEYAPPDMELRGKAVSSYAWIGEYEPLAVNLSNTSGGEMKLFLKLEGNEKLVSQAELRTAVPSDTAGGHRPLDALPLPHENGLLIPPGTTRQAFVILRTHGMEPGTYDMSLVISGECVAQPVTQTMTLKIAPVQFPEKPAVNTYSWAYVNCWGACRNNQEAAIADLKAHYQRVYVLHPACVPSFKLREGGKGVDMDFTFHDEMLKKHEPFDQISWFWGWDGEKPGGDRFGGPWMSEAWKANFAEWLNAWVAHMKSLGYGYDCFFMYPCDETLEAGFRDLCRLMKEIDPKLRIWADPTGGATTEEIKAIAPFIDVWCPHLNGFDDRPADRKLIFDTGKIVWTYLCSGPGKDLSPLEYYRLMFWRAFDQGYRGCGFWAYADTGWTPSSAWDDFDGTHHDYAIVYDSGSATPEATRREAIIPSRRWEAWRQGVEDYEYMWQLERALASAEKNGMRQDHDKLLAIRKTISRKNISSASLADVRMRMTEAIITLREAK